MKHDNFSHWLEAIWTGWTAFVQVGKMLMLSAHSDAVYVEEAANSGARGHPPFPTARRRPPADGEHRKLKLGDQPSDQICAKEEEKQANTKEHVVECAHSRLFLQVVHVGEFHQAQRRGPARL